MRDRGNKVSKPPITINLVFLHMNITYCDPTLFRIRTLLKLVEVFHIDEIYNLMPALPKACSANTIITSKLRVSRKENETIDDVTKRSVYTFLDKISRPIFIENVFFGKEIFDKFQNSRSIDFSSNINLPDSNLLILNHDKRVFKEKQSVYFSSYLFNILKKYNSTINYQNRLCFTNLSPQFFIDDEDESSLNDIINDRYSAQLFRSNANMQKYLLKIWNVKSIYSLANQIFSKKGLRLHQEHIEEAENERKYQEQMDRAFYDDGLTEVERWGADSELDYIYNNGGDWIDY